MQIRPRRLRKSPIIREMVAETRLSKDMFIYPYFVTTGKGLVQPIDAMPGVFESAVIGVPHPDFGEGVTAIVVRTKPEQIEANHEFYRGGHAVMASPKVRELLNNKQRTNGGRAGGRPGQSQPQAAN